MTTTTHCVAPEDIMAFLDGELSARVTARRFGAIRVTRGTQDPWSASWGGGQNKHSCAAHKFAVCILDCAGQLQSETILRAHCWPEQEATNS